MVHLRHRSSATPLALVYAALLVYASLYPFAGWRWPPGQALANLTLLPWTRWQGGFDLWSNLFGYLPLGALICLAARRSGWRSSVALALAMLAPALLSYAMEVLQQFLPKRVPAMEDLLTNSAGAAAGALLALAFHGLGMVQRWHLLRERWFARDSAAALALLTLWPLGLLFPTPVPLGLGQVSNRLGIWLTGLLAGMPWAEPVHTLLATTAPPEAPLRPLSEILIVAAGLLSPCVVAFAVMPPGLRRVVAVVGALLLSLGAMTLSTLLNFGPGHALAWLGPSALPGLVLGSLLGLALVAVPCRSITGIGLMVLTGLVVGMAQAPADPYFAQSLLAWEQGRFVRFHGLAQWLGWLWPYAAMAWLLTRLGRRATTG